MSQKKAARSNFQSTNHQTHILTAENSQLMKQNIFPSNLFKRKQRRSDQRRGVRIRTRFRHSCTITHPKIDLSLLNHPIRTSGMDTTSRKRCWQDISTVDELRSK